MNNGLLSGIKSKQWTDYVPKWRANKYAGTGAVSTQPSLGNGTSWGRYTVLGSGLVVCQLGFTFGSTTTFGSTGGFWEFSLPVPGNRANGAADLPIGTCLATLGTGASVQLTQVGIATLADPGDVSQGWGKATDEDYWVQAFCTRLSAVGVSGDANSPAFTSGATSVNVTHGLSPYTPSAYDVDVVATNAPSTNPQLVYVSATSSTTFTISIGASSTTTPLTYAWRVNGEPNSGGGGILVCANAPFAWAAGSSIGLSVTYEARR